MATNFTEIEEVRNKTTDDTTAISDDTIARFLLKYKNRNRDARIYHVAADVIDYLLRDIDWNTNTIGDRTYSENIKVETAKRYRAQARAYGVRLV